jgi:translation elongation factor EF-1alpha
MKIKQTFCIALIASTLSSCSNEKLTFEMPVEEVTELKGFILKGVSLSGTVKSGCITNEHQISVRRKGKVIYSEKMRLLEVLGLKENQTFNGEAYTGERIVLYIPDGKKGDIAPGDVVISTVSSCTGGPVRK